MALRLMKLRNTLIKQVTSPPSTRLPTRIERRFSNHATDVPLTEQEKEAAREGFKVKLGFTVVAVVGVGVIFMEIRSNRADNRKEEAWKQAFEAVEQRIENLIREQDKLTQRHDDLRKESLEAMKQRNENIEREIDKLTQRREDLKKHWSTEPKRSDTGREI